MEVGVLDAVGVFIRLPPSPIPPPAFAFGVGLSSPFGGPAERISSSSAAITRAIAARPRRPADDDRPGLRVAFSSLRPIRDGGSTLGRGVLVGCLSAAVTVRVGPAERLRAGRTRPGVKCEESALIVSSAIANECCRVVVLEEAVLISIHG